MGHGTRGYQGPPGSAATHMECKGCLAPTCPAPTCPALPCPSPAGAVGVHWSQRAVHSEGGGPGLRAGAAESGASPEGLWGGDHAGRGQVGGWAPAWDEVGRGCRCRHEAWRGAGAGRGQVGSVVVLPVVGRLSRGLLVVGAGWGAAWLRRWWWWGLCAG